MTFGITLTAGGVSSGWIKKLTRAVTGWFFVTASKSVLIGIILAVMTRDIPKKRINRSGHEEKRRILQN